MEKTKSKLMIPSFLNLCLMFLPLVILAMVVGKLLKIKSNDQTFYNNNNIPHHKSLSSYSVNNDGIIVKQSKKKIKKT